MVDCVLILLKKIFSLKNLIHFLIKYSPLFVFIALEAVAVILISNNKGYQRSIFLTSTNAVAGWVLEKNNKIVEFFKLKEANQNLANENTDLLNRITELENRVASITDSVYISDWKYVPVPPEKQYKYISAKVIRNTTHFTQNYITLNKGADLGIRPDMGVISTNGVVGIVETVSPKFSKVIPILNPLSMISAKFKDSNYYGPLVWDGKDYRYAKLNDIARHVKFSLGDTLVTSGLVKTFPEGIVIGTIDNFTIEESDAYYNIYVKLGVDFRTLTHVKVIDYQNYDEQKELENKQFGEKSQNDKFN